MLQVASELPFNEIGDFKEYISLLEILLGPILHEYYAFFNEDFKRNIFDSFFLPIHDNGNDGIASITLCFMGYANNFKSCIETNISNNSDEIDKKITLGKSQTEYRILRLEKMKKAIDKY